MSVSGEKKTPAWLLERLAQGELEPDRVAELRARLDGEGRALDAELGALERSNREILAALPKETVGAAIRRRAESDDAASARGRRARWPRLVAPLALAGTLGMALVLIVGRADHGRSRPEGSQVAAPGAEEPTRIKGEIAAVPRLLVYRQRPGGEGAERLSSGARATRGDRLQLAYTSAGEGLYGVLLSIDGAGRVTQHLPEEGARSAPPLRSVREIRLPSSYQLDDAPGFERFLLVTARASFTVGAALDAARALAGQGAGARSLPLPLPPAFHQTSILLDKTSQGTP